MPRPPVVALTPDTDLATRLAACWNARFELRICPSAEELPRVLEDGTAVALLFDFRQLRNGGHFEDRLLEQVQERYPALPLALLCPNSCPEPLERRMACAGLVRFDAMTSAEQIAAAFPAEPLRAEPVRIAEPPAEKRPTSVLSGITRQFETQSAQLVQMLGDLEIAARHDVTVLLIGETGSGKTYLSRLIHEVSPRRTAPFIPLACGALPSELIESELFGHVKGAFTSAHADKEGKFVAAGQGTVLLDEIDVLGLEQQVKLLRVIETGEFEPVGSNKTHHVQARLVVASNLELQPLVERGRFRPDLYYRLNMLKFEIPPLRRRKMDIVPLAQKFVRQFSLKHNIAVDRIDSSLLSALHNYPWPGNVRELENVIQRAVIYCRDGVLTAQHLPQHILAGIAGPTNDPSVVLGSSSGHADRSRLGDQIALTEREIIEQALFNNSYSRTRTARELGISRVTLYNKMRKYEITR